MGLGTRLDVCKHGSTNSEWRSRCGQRNWKIHVLLIMEVVLLTMHIGRKRYKRENCERFEIDDLRMYTDH